MIMTSASSLAFPGSRTLAGWWRQLASLRPQALAVGYLFLHRVEAPVSVVKPNKLERFSRLVLQALALDAGRHMEADVVHCLEARLHLNRHMLFQVLRLLGSEGLVEPAAAWSLTARGQQGLAQGEYPIDVLERRVFHFLERRSSAGIRTQPPHFLNLAGGSALPWQAGSEFPFDLGLLQECFDKPDAWKQHYGFPLDVRLALSASGTANAIDPGAWQRVVVDRPERMLIVLVLSDQPDGTRRLQGFGARQDGWLLQSSQAVLTLDTGWEHLFPELSVIPTELLTRSWRAWARPRSVPDHALESSTLELAGHSLRVRAPAETVERLRAARSDVFKGEAWLLVGEGELRPALQLELSELPE
jgi:hypothetical protein